MLLSGKTSRRIAGLIFGIFQRWRFLSFLKKGLEEAKEPGASDDQKHGQRDVSRGQGGPRIAEIAITTLVGGDVIDAHIALGIVLAAFILCDAILPCDEIFTNSSSLDDSTNFSTLTGDS